MHLSCKEVSGRMHLALQVMQVLEQLKVLKHNYSIMYVYTRRSMVQSTMAKRVQSVTLQVAWQNR